LFKQGFFLLFSISRAAVASAFPRMLFSAKNMSEAVIYRGAQGKWES